jgi:hypothetical protein
MGELCTVDQLSTQCFDQHALSDLTDTRKVSFCKTTRGPVTGEGLWQGCATLCVSRICLMQRRFD